MPRARDTPILLLDESISLARAVLKECESNRILFPANVWVFSALAKAISSATSARALILARQYWDAKLVTRSLYDTVIDIYFFLHDPSMTSQLVDLVRIEAAVDAYEELEYRAQLLGKRIQELPRDAVVLVRVSDYRWATCQPAFHARGSDWPKRWSKITLDEKRARIRSTFPGNWLPLFDYTVRTMGNAAAHSRVLALQTHVVQAKDGRIRITPKPRLPKPFGNRRLLVLEPFTCLLGASAVIIENFQLRPALSKRAESLMNRWKGMLKKH